MYRHRITLRVRYADTDRMDQVYYGRYAEFFEVGRVETMRSLGISYRKLEEMGILLPVIDFRVRYLAPLSYDEEVVIETAIPELPRAAVRFDYTLFNEAGRRAAEGMTVLAFVDAATRKVRRAPEMLLAALAPYFREQ